MSDSQLLEAVLQNTQIPHQCFVVITDQPTFSGFPIFRDLLLRAVTKSEVLLVSPLRLASHFSSHYGSGIKLVDLTTEVYGYSEVTWSDIESRIITSYQALPKGTHQIFIDSIDILAEDYGSANVLKVVRKLLKFIKDSKAPSRLVVSLSGNSSLLSGLIAPTSSPAFTILHPLPLPLLSQLSSSYLAPISSDHAFWQILENAKLRRVADDLAYRGIEGIDIEGDWAFTSSTTGSSASAGPSRGNAAIQVLVRKATGGAKGISRSLEGATTKAPGLGASLTVVPLGDLVHLNPITAPSTGVNPAATKNATHEELGLSFNLNLTDEQKRRRGEVPIPYVHEGEGVEYGWEDEEEDEDDEEI